jgi:phage shock protein E
MNNYSGLLVAAAVIVVFLLLKRLGLASPALVSEWLREGAVVVDVRSPEEFASGHVDGALNVPLSSLGTDIERAVPDKTRPVLVHCLSGARSAIGRRILQSRGYSRVHNLGSLRRAMDLTRRKP